MASFLSQASTAAHLRTERRYVSITQLLHLYPPKLYRLKCCAQNKENPAAKNSSSIQHKVDGAEPQNVVLKIAWYASELLGIAASALRPPPSTETVHESPALFEGDGSEALVDRAAVVETIKLDFQRSYFVTGNVTLGAYEEDCEFADPAGSFKGLRRFKRNCTNFGSLIQKSNMKLMKWEDFEDKGIGHWRFSCILSFPWRPILSATGYTEYYFDPKSGRVCRHVEHWNVPKMTLLKQIFKPSRQAKS